MVDFNVQLSTISRAFGLPIESALKATLLERSSKINDIGAHYLQVHCPAPLLLSIKITMQLSDECINEFKEIYKKTKGEDISDEDARESARNLLGFYELMFEISKKEVARERRLKKEPQGFHLESDGYSCGVCGNNMTAENSWYNWYGQTCLLCRNAIEKGIIPTFVCKHHDSYYKMWQLKSTFKIHPQTARKLLRLGKLKARIVLTEDGHPHEYILLKKENPGLIEKFNPGWKSYQRHRNKVHDKWAREQKLKWREEMRQMKKKLKK